MQHLNSVIRLISESSPLQGRAMKSFMDEHYDQCGDESERIVEGILHYAGSVGLSIDDIVRGYISICDSTRREQLYFARKGEYRLSDVETVRAQVYENETVMQPYMLGLALSQIFWTQHREISGFFRRCISHIDFSDYLEIGPGHGLFLIEAIKRKPSAHFTAIDLSETSIRISEGMLNAFLGESNKAKILLADPFVWEPAKKFDFITMGEVLEHVTDMDTMMRRIEGFLADDGHLWISTCANCPTIDHVLLFESAQHIRDELTRCGFKIIDELVVETKTGLRNRSGAQIPTTNYAGLLNKA